MKITVQKLLCLSIVLGISYGSHVHRATREDVQYPSSANLALPMFRDEDGAAIKGMYMMEEPSGRLPGREAIQYCQVTKNSAQKDFDFICGCNQQLGTDRPIGNLVFNLTDCNREVWFIWSELEASLSPKYVTFVGVIMTLTNQTVEEGFDSSIMKLTFDNSTFRDLPEDSFKGLKALQELRFLDCNIVNISENAVRDHTKLKTIEIIESRIGEIHENAFLNLPAIEDFAISFSLIIEIQGLGINLNTNDEASECNPSSRTGHSRSLDLEESMERLNICMEYLVGRQARGVNDHNDSMHTFDSVMGRQIQGPHGLPLPLGKRFLLYQNQIQSIRTNAVNSNAFGFLILGVNDITLIESKAFNMQLHNPCEVSAALFASNNITKLSDHAFAGISNKMDNNNTTFISLNKNKFDEVQAQSFQIEKDIKIFYVDENIFKCDCMDLSGFLKDQQSLSFVQAELKKNIISKANCTTGVGLTTFKYSCDEFSTLVPPGSGTTSTASHSNLASVVIIGFILMLINKIVT